MEYGLDNVLARAIKEATEAATADGKINISTLHVSFAAHVILDAVAKALEVEKQQFKKDCGYGQPLAYFI
jgi:hypothetical protein